MSTTTQPNMNQALGDEDRCAERLAPIWRVADTFAHYPCATETVVELLRAGGKFDCSHELLEGWCRSGMIHDCKLRQGQFAWTAQNILTALVQLDTWRRWLLCPEHISKMTAVEIEESRASAAGTTTFTDLATFDCCAFVEILSRCNDPAVRSTFAVALKTKLRSLGVLDQ